MVLWRFESLHCLFFGCETTKDELSAECFLVDRGNILNILKSLANVELTGSCD